MLFPQESGKYDANLNADAVSVDYVDSELLLSLIILMLTAVDFGDTHFSCRWVWHFALCTHSHTAPAYASSHSPS